MVTGREGIFSLSSKPQAGSEGPAGKKEERKMEAHSWVLQRLKELSEEERVIFLSAVRPLYQQPVDFSLFLNELDNTIVGSLLSNETIFDLLKESHPSLLKLKELNLVWKRE